MRTARAVALRARVERRRADLVLRAALGRAACATASAWGRPWATPKGSGRRTAPPVRVRVRVVDCGGVPATVITRPMLPDDVNGAAAVGTAALEVLYPVEFRPDDAAARAELTRRSRRQGRPHPRPRPRGRVGRRARRRDRRRGARARARGRLGALALRRQAGAAGPGHRRPAAGGRAARRRGLPRGDHPQLVGPACDAPLLPRGLSRAPVPRRGRGDQPRADPGGAAGPPRRSSEADRATIDAASRYVRGASHLEDIAHDDRRRRPSCS